MLKIPYSKLPNVYSHAIRNKSSNTNLKKYDFVKITPEI